MRPFDKIDIKSNLIFWGSCNKNKSERTKNNKKDTGYSFWDRLRNFLHKFTNSIYNFSNNNKLDYRVTPPPRRPPLIMKWRRNLLSQKLSVFPRMTKWDFYLIYPRHATLYHNHLQLACQEKCQIPLLCKPIKSF